MRAAFHEQLDEISDLLAEMAIAAGAAMNQATQALLNADLAIGRGGDLRRRPPGRAHRRGGAALLRRRGPAAAGGHRPAAGDRFAADLLVPGAHGRPGRPRGQAGPAALPELQHPQQPARDVRRDGRLEDAIAAKTAAVITTKDITLGPDIERYDQEVDRLHRELFTTVLSPSWSYGVEAAIDATLLSRYYERYADHAVSIARRVVMHVVTGEPYADTSLEAPAGS